MSISKKKEEEVTEVIREAMRDLDEFYSKIRKSQKIIQYKDDGELIAEIFVCILASFSTMQLLELSIKAKMVNNETKESLSKKQRFLISLSTFQSKFELIVNQQLGHME